MKIELFYDKECPFCNSYAQYIKIKENHNLILTNARDSINQLKDFKSLGFDINDGFIIKVDDKKLYQGVDAIVFLNKLSEKKVFFPDNFFFRTFVYSSIKTVRKIVLFIFDKNSKL
ncbi:DCC1-like thiol-disulfide oxidoreductase family protein [Arcobacter sp. LA11]|uniref:DCC1-like thiol-disulfide oxidoreductase family protein n=1 Tax=Arcobacter sp. LA11 TaxID=1898176 RepID=UPI000932BE0E|nr:DCC1-like thiol-disulfide oxidoreductase family protein [Arcobacter sp. LA11]